MMRSGAVRLFSMGYFFGGGVGLGGGGGEGLLPGLAGLPPPCRILVGIAVTHEVVGAGLALLVQFPILSDVCKPGPGSHFR